MIDSALLRDKGIRNRPVFYFFSLLLIGQALLTAGPVEAQSAPEGEERPPNIVFIMADDLGYRHLGAYGQEKIQTPNIDRLAAQGMKFTQAYAGAAVCAPSRSVLMTGMHVGHTRIRSNGQGMFLFPVDVTVAEVLGQAGYAAGIFGKWGLGDIGSPGVPWKQGFDAFFGQLDQVHAHFYYPYWLWQGDDHYMLPANEGEQHNQYAADMIHEQAMDFIRRHARAKDQPFFAYLAYTLPHSELAVPDESAEPYIGEFPEVELDDAREGYIDAEYGYATYAGMISRLDMYVGQIMDLLEELGLAEETLVIFTSDNGPQGGGMSDRLVAFFNGNGPLRGTKSQVYEGGIRVPLIARWPGHIEAGSVSDLPIYFPDVMPTLAKLAGTAAPGNIDGLSFLPTLLGEAGQKEHTFMYWAHCRPDGGPPHSQAVRRGQWKAVQPARGAPVELYNLEEDIDESNNVAEAHPEIVEQMKQYMERAWTERYDFKFTGTRPQIADFVR